MTEKTEKVEEIEETCKTCHFGNYDKCKLTLKFTNEEFWCEDWCKKGDVKRSVSILEHQIARNLSKIIKY